MCGWVAIPECLQEEFREIAEGRDRLSAGASNTRVWTTDFNLRGLPGEWLFEQLSGIPMNREIAIRDGGTDFPGIDVKTTTYLPEVALKVSPNDRLKAPVYFLAVFDPENWRVRPAGYASRQKLAHAPVGRHGPHGLAHAVPEAQLVSADWFLPRLLGWMGMQ